MIEIVDVFFGLFSTILFFAVIISPLKRFVGVLAHPPCSAMNSTGLHNSPFREVRKCLAEMSDADVESRATLLLNYFLISYIFAYTVCALSFFSASTFQSGVESQSSFETALHSGFLMGLLVTSSTRICSTIYSVSLLKLVFNLLLGILGGAICCMAIIPDLMTDFTDYGLKSGYPSFLALSIPYVLLAFVLTEAIAIVSRVIFPTCKISPIGLYSGLYELYYERPLSLGEREVESVGFDLISSHCGPGRPNSVKWVTVSPDKRILDALSTCSKALMGNQAMDIKIITIPEIVDDIKRDFVGPIHIKTIPNIKMLKCSRFLIINDEIGVKYQRIPPHNDKPANVGQLVEDYVEVHSLVNVFNSVFAKIEDSNSLSGGELSSTGTHL